MPYPAFLCCTLNIEVLWLCYTLSYPVPPKQAHTLAWSKELLRTFVPHSLVHAQKLVVVKKDLLCNTFVQKESLYKGKLKSIWSHNTGSFSMLIFLADVGKRSH